MADIVVTTNSLVVIIVIHASASASTSASAFASRRTATSCFCLPRLVVALPPINLRLRNHHLPFYLPLMVGCYVLGPLPLVTPSHSLAGYPVTC